MRLAAATLEAAQVMGMYKATQSRVNSAGLGARRGKEVHRVHVIFSGALALVGRRAGKDKKEQIQTAQQTSITASPARSIVGTEGVRVKSPSITHV